LAARQTALAQAAAALREGQIVAVKGLGGFHLLVDARSEAAIQRLRARKHREEKPLALMFPCLTAVREACEVSALEATLLTAPEAPIVLLRRRAHDGRPGAARLAAGVAPRNPYLGVLLPYTPLHHLLLADLGFPVVATSGNLRDEPICTDEHEARERLRGVADLFLVHDRPIVRHVDDSIVRIVAGRELVLRRARGYAPLPVLFPPIPGEPWSAGQPTVGERRPPVILGVGGHLKNTVALGTAQGVFVSQHIGDLETVLALQAFRRVIEDLPRLLSRAPERVVTDLHPEYVSTKEAARTGLPRCSVQHHFAHVLACLAENELDGPVLGVAWDGTGYGLDGTIWGGEFLVADRRGFRRFAALRPFPLPGGDQAMREPRRAALGLLFAWRGDAGLSLGGIPTLAAFDPPDLAVLQRMLQAELHTPLTSSIGRLFDAVASLSGVRQRMAFEGQAAMELEWLVTADTQPTPYEFPLRPAGEPAAGVPGGGSPPQWWIDWAPMIEAMIADVRRGVPPGTISARFHQGLIRLVVAVAARAQLERVVLAGGCFQHRLLLEGMVEALRRAGRQIYWPQRVPPNDGGLALGQVVAGWWGAAEGAAPSSLSAEGHNSEH
jgi:hydrogenase maturation protein HypF